MEQGNTHLHMQNRHSDADTHTYAAALLGRFAILNVDVGYRLSRRAAFLSYLNEGMFAEDIFITDSKIASLFLCQQTCFSTCEGGTFMEKNYISSH